jgi:hypothetical protein
VLNYFIYKLTYKLRQAKIRERLRLIEKYYISDEPCSGSGTALTWPGTTHALYHSLIIGWKSPGSSLPTD